MKCPWCGREDPCGTEACSLAPHEPSRWNYPTASIADQIAAGLRYIRERYGSPGDKREVEAEMDTTTTNGVQSSGAVFDEYIGDRRLASYCEREIARGRAQLVPNGHRCVGCRERLFGDRNYVCSGCEWDNAAGMQVRDVPRMNRMPRPVPPAVLEMIRAGRELDELMAVPEPMRSVLAVSRANPVVAEGLPFFKVSRDAPVSSIDFLRAMRPKGRQR